MTDTKLLYKSYKEEYEEMSKKMEKFNAKEDDLVLARNRYWMMIFGIFTAIILGIIVAVLFH